jgi:3-deoxy-D-manno-octulosonic-acid transferase
MRSFLGLAIYRLLLPLLFMAAFPGWIVKMLRRGGFGTGLAERAAIFTEPPEEEPCGAVHLHAVSVGETLLALKLLREWLAADPGRRFVLATGTATGHAVATTANIPGLRVTYAPLDFPSMVRRYLRRFEPAQIVLIEGEVWPHLLRACRRRNIPVRLVNARVSPRSARRFRRFAPWLRPVFGMLDAVAVQEPEDAAIWSELGVPPERVHVAGSLKFDPGSGPRPARRAAFGDMLGHFGAGRPVIVVASTHPGEEAWIAESIRAAGPELLPVIVPRHAERRREVREDLQRAGFEVVLRSAFQPPGDPRRACLVVDSTGELRDWTAHADAVVIGKSFLATGGQNPAEAILAAKPLIFGPHMENFEPLASRLADAGACHRAATSAELTAAIRAATGGNAAAATGRASAVLARHEGATKRLVAMLRDAPE